MKTALITAFEPFDGERCNPCWQVAERLHQRTIVGAEVAIDTALTTEQDLRLVGGATH